MQGKRSLVSVSVLRYTGTVTSGVRVDPRSPEPIWSQIEAEVRRLVGSHRLEPGASLPSVRELARELRVNPATVVRAYQRLTDAGLLEVRRGDGTYVANRPTRPHQTIQRDLKSAAERYASVASSAGADLATATAELRAAWRRIGATEGER
jgi:GntR family transcriptional regulator